MIDQINRKRIYLYLAFTFGISWATGLVIFLTGGLADSPAFEVAGLQLNLALVLMATAYMFGPAIGNVLTRWVTKEGKTELMLRANLRQGRWVFYLAAWVLPAVLTILGMVIYFIIFPRYFDSDLTFLRQQLVDVGMADVNPWTIAVIQTVQAILVAPLLNAIPTFGEEFGWRGYLQPKLMPLGGRKAILYSGIIWGVWHWPVILMGYNYGFDYFGAPALGPLAMVWFTLVVSVLFGWVTIKTDSVWPAVIGHGALNGIAALSLIFIQGNPDTLLGPTPVGLIGGIGFTLLALFIFFKPGAFEPKASPENQEEFDAEPDELGVN